MATWTYPPIDPEALSCAEKDSQSRELQWFLSSLRESLGFLRTSLTDTATLIGPRLTSQAWVASSSTLMAKQGNPPGPTLVLSTSQSESVKGFVTRVGSRITRGDVRLRLSSLESPLRFAVAGSALANQEENRDAEDFSVVLSQVAIVQELIDDCLSDIEPQSDQNNGMLDSRLSRTQLCALHRRLGEMRSTLNGEKNVKPWYLHSLSPQSFDPHLPSNLSLHFTIADGALVLNLRTLRVASEASTFGISYLINMMGSGRSAAHDEEKQTFSFHGENVVVLEKIRIGSQDPDLLSATLKIAALEKEILRWMQSLDSLADGNDQE